MARVGLETQHPHFSNDTLKNKDGNLIKCMVLQLTWLMNKCILQ